MKANKAGINNVLKPYFVEKDGVKYVDGTRIKEAEAKIMEKYNTNCVVSTQPLSNGKDLMVIYSVVTKGLKKMLEYPVL